MKVESLENWKTTPHSQREGMEKEKELRVQWTGDQPSYRQGSWVTYQAQFRNGAAQSPFLAIDHSLCNGKGAIRWDAPDGEGLPNLSHPSSFCSFP